MQETMTETVGFRLSPQQEQLLSTGGLAPATTQCAFTLDGPVDIDRLRAALDVVVTRHEILRTTFLQPPGMRSPQQVIGAESAAAWSLQEQPGSAKPLEDGEALQELMASAAERQFDLERGPLLQALLIGGGEEVAMLLLSACAVCVDATSLLLLANELCESYSGAGSPQEPLQYADYAEWRHELIGGEEPETRDGLAFWREDATDRPGRPRILFALGAGPDGTQAATVALDLREVAPAALQSAAREAGVTVAVFMEAAWHSLLARLSSTSELLVAGWCDGRAQPDLAGAIGAYEQPTPIRSRFQDTTTFAEVLDQVRRARAKAVRWQDCAGAEDLVAVASQAAAGLAFHAVGSLSRPARQLLALRVPPSSTRLTLVLALDGDTGVAGDLVYDRQTVTEEDALEIARRFATLLTSALADPSRPVAQLEIMDVAERQHLRSAASANSAAPDVTDTVPERFERQAQLTPNRPAVIGASRSLTYAELDAASNRLAKHLQQMGPIRDRTVGLCMERTPSMVVALLAILKAGGAYVPLNHEHPQARISHQLLDADATVLITEQHLLDSLPALQVGVVCVDRDAEAIAACEPTSPGPAAAAEDLAYVMYTSGSTGTPKGVAITHGNLANYAASIAARLSVEDHPAGLVFGVVSAISTDLCNTSIFPPLVSGGAIRLLSSDAAIDGGLLALELAGQRMDVLKIAPSHLHALLGAGTSEALPQRWLLVGGEALSWELVEQVRSLAPSCSIVNHYGPTETTVGCLTYTVDDRVRPDSLTVPIGFPLAGVRAYVLDPRLAPVPDGIPGELCIAGAGVARGYLAAAGASDGGFAADPFADGRMYRTGDRVRRLRDGAIEFLGRLDDQVKIRGFRIEPGEIEVALLAHPAIRQAAVSAEDDERGGLRLVAYIVSPQAPTVEELRAFLGEALPEHMIPSAFRGVEALPLSASGKVDRRALAGLAEVQAQREADYVEPRDEVERQIAEIWGGLLGVERVGALDDFFALGGHSLLATQATMKIRQLYGDIPLRALLAAPTVAALAEVVRATGVAGDGGR